MSKQIPPLPHQTILRTLHSEELPEPPYTVYGFTSEQLQAYATAATEPLLQRIAELERVCDIFEGNWNECLADCENIAALKERIAELERQLEEARNLALEEAAVECDKRAHAGDAGALMAARAIRALKGAKT